HGVTTYMTPPTTSGWPSCPPRTPVENVHTGWSVGAFGGVMSARALKRVAAKSFAGMLHSPSPPAGPGRPAAATLPHKRAPAPMQAKIEMRQISMRPRDSILGIAPPIPNLEQ